MITNIVWGPHHVGGGSSEAHRRDHDAADLPGELTLRPAGYSPLYTRIVDEIVGSQVRGFGAAIVLIAVFSGCRHAVVEAGLSGASCERIPGGDDARRLWVSRAFPLMWRQQRLPA